MMLKMASPWIVTLFWPYREVFHDPPQPLKAGITASTGSAFLGIWLFCRGYLDPAACYGTQERSTECAVPFWRPRGTLVHMFCFVCFQQAALSSDKALGFTTRSLHQCRKA